jgi:hypothetical protein
MELGCGGGRRPPVAICCCCEDDSGPVMVESDDKREETQKCHSRRPKAGNRDGWMGGWEVVSLGDDIIMPYFIWRPYFEIILGYSDESTSSYLVSYGVIRSMNYVLYE